MGESRWVQGRFRERSRAGHCGRCGQHWQRHGAEGVCPVCPHDGTVYVFDTELEDGQPTGRAIEVCPTCCYSPHHNLDFDGGLT